MPESRLFRERPSSAPYVSYAMFLTFIDPIALVILCLCMHICTCTGMSVCYTYHFYPFLYAPPPFEPGLGSKESAIMATSL